jgi:hypothetical protein
MSISVPVFIQMSVVYEGTSEQNRETTEMHLLRAVAEWGVTDLPTGYKLGIMNMDSVLKNCEDKLLQHMKIKLEIVCSIKQYTRSPTASIAV